MHRYQQLADRMLHQFADELYPEKLTWKHQQLGELVVRCGVIAVESLPYAERQAFLANPAFVDGRAQVTVHPDDLWPPEGSVCEHPRFGRIQLLKIGPQSYWTGSRKGAASWTN